MATLNNSVPPAADRISNLGALGIGLAVSLGVGAAILTAVDLGGQVVLWENVHWTIFYGLGFAIAFRGFRTSSGRERRIRAALATVSLFWAAAQGVWLAQSALQVVVFPLPSDLMTFAALVPAVVALDLAVRHAVHRRERLSLYLDCAITFLAIATVVTLAFGHLVSGHDPFAGALLLSFPILCLSIAGAGLIAALATNASPRDGGLYALLFGTFLYGVGYISWVAAAPAVPLPGTPWNYLFSIGAVGIGIAGATFRLDSRTSSASIQFGMFFRDVLPAAAVATAVGCLIIANLTQTEIALVRPLGWAVILVAVLRQVLLVRERSSAVQSAVVATRELSVAEERHRQLIERIPAVIYIDERARADSPRSTVSYVSAEATRLLSYSVDELKTDDLWSRLIHPDDAPLVTAAENDHFRTGEPLRQTFRMRDRDGRVLWVLDEATLVRLPHGVLQSHGVLMDITAQKHAETAVRESEEQQRQIIETASSAYVAMDTEGVVIDWNERATETFGYSRAEAIGRRMGDLIIPEDQRALHEAGLRRFAIVGTGPLVGRRVEVTALDRGGRLFPVELTIWPVRSGGILHFSALIHDITERRRLEDELRHQAFHDSLTGLANRALFTDRLGHALERRHGMVGVLFFDVDDFKLINDGLGHPAGDGLLVQVAQRLGDLVRSSDTAARLGGDEFAVLLEETTESDAVNVAERIVQSFLPPFDVAGHRVTAQASIGIALGGAGSSAAEVLREADAAMYTAKHRGKGVWQVFDPSMAGDGLLEIELRSDLKQAIEAGEIGVAFQPIVDLATRRTIGVEALARWHHPTRGDIAPYQFIPLAEAAELIVPLGRWVLRQACRTVQGWRTSGDGRSATEVHLSVNISPRQLLHGSIVEDVRAALADSGLAPANLTLEITEGVLVEEAGPSLAALEELKSLGVRIAIDDFGTGYSSLSYLSRLPIDVLKIDRSFIADIGTSRQAAALVRSIVKIGQTLHLETVAEGIETEEQLDRLLRLGAKLGQGYLFARPLPAEELEARLAASHTLGAA